MKWTAMALVAASLFWPAGARAEPPCFDHQESLVFIDGAWTCQEPLNRFSHQNLGISNVIVTPKCDDGWFLVQSNGSPMCAHELRGPTHN